MSTIPAEIIHGDLPLLLSDNENHGKAGELDTLTLNFVCNYPDWEDDLAEEGYVKGDSIDGYHAMFVDELSRGNRSAQTCEVTVQCLGLIAEGDKRRRTLGVNGQQISVGPYEQVIIAVSEDETGLDPDAGSDDEPVLVKRRVPKLDAFGEIVYGTIVTPSGFADRWNIRQPVVTVTDTYFTTTRPDMSVVGTSITPDNAPEVPEFAWTGYGNAVRYNHPSGWVLDDRQVEELFTGAGSGSDDGEGLFAVTDTYGNYVVNVPD